MSLLFDYLSYRGHVNAELFITIHSQQVIDQSLFLSCYCAGAGVNSFAGKIEFLAERACYRCNHQDGYTSIAV
jgi:hypothetical protein